MTLTKCENFVSIATYINNCYMKPSRLFITGWKEISSNEGTTQGDPIAMGIIKTFQGYNITITTDGHRHVRAPVGSNENKEEFVIAKVAEWVKQLEILINFACIEPQATFFGFIQGLRHRYTFLMRTIPGISHLLKPLDDAIDTFIKVLLQGFALSTTEPVLFSLPVKYGGMGLIINQEEYQNSREITKESTNKVIRKIKFQDNHVSTAKIKITSKSKEKAE